MAAVGIRNPHNCELLGPEGVAVQVAITVVCAFSMIAVWLLEPVRRPFFVWAFDMSKQVFAAGYGKAWNIAQSIVFSDFFLLHEDYNDECVWYLMSITIDCLLLTFLCWGVTVYTRPILLEKFDIDIGDYDSYEETPRGENGERPRYHSHEHVRETDFGEKVGHYFQQLGIWILIITVCRLFISFVLFFTQHQVYVAFQGVFPMLGLTTPTEKLIFSVLVWPFFADTFQIVVQDSFLKKKRENDVK